MFSLGIRKEEKKVEENLPAIIKSKPNIADIVAEKAQAQVNKQLIKALPGQPKTNSVVLSDSFPQKRNPGSINPPPGIFEEPFWQNYGADARGIKYKRPYKMSNNILRQISSKIGVIAAIQNTRWQQTKPFFVQSFNDDEVGFMAKLKDRDATPTEDQKKIMKEATEFMLNCGYTKNMIGKEIEEECERDNLVKSFKKMTTDIMSIDQIAISLRRDQKGRLLDFWILDAATIYPTRRDIGYEGDREIRYVQEVDGKVVEVFTKDDIIFDFMNSRSDLRKSSFGYSYIEQCVEMITSWIFAHTYNKDQFNISSQPRGFFTFEGGDVGQEDIEELQRQWIAMFSGVKGMWRTPFLQYGAKWNNLAPSNRDLEYEKYMKWLEGWIAAIHGMDIAELGQKNSNSQFVLNENKSKEINYSQDRGLKDLLSHDQYILNRVKSFVPEWDFFNFTFTGMEKKDQKAEQEVDKQQIETYMTINEKRKEKDLPPIEGGDIIANPQFVQMKQAEQQQAAMEAQGGAPGEGEEPPEGEEGEVAENEWEIDESDLEVEKSLQKAFGRENAVVGDIRQHADGFWYQKTGTGEWIKLGKDKRKAEAFAAKKKQKQSQPAKTGKKPTLAVGHKVRVKPTDKSTLASGARGLVAKIKEVGDGFVRLVDDAGKIYKVNQMALEVAKSNDFFVSEIDLIKSQEIVKPKSDYIIIELD
jgi:HK97 family phage portal protein